MKGMLVIISGPSGSGKGTVVKRLDPSRNYALSISVTTRAPRLGEVDGRDYFFCRQEEFIRMRDQNELLEHAVYCGHFYGTPKRYVQEQIAKGKAVVLEIEVNGALQVRDKFKDSVLIFLMPPTMEELHRRLVNRNTEGALAIEDRLKKANEEIKLVDKYDYLVVNDDIANAVNQIDVIVEAESLKPKRCMDAIKRFAMGSEAGTPAEALSE
ncbi:MAG: guanylate kinase [Clostridiales bacterium]|jgi:guanylate kinase|nr:guanylate kinase [Clostridiales bacterium]